MTLERNTGKKIDVDNIDLDLMKEKTTPDPGLIEFAHTVGSAIVKPTDAGKISGMAVTAMHDQTHRQFKQLYDQMQTLVEQARDLKNRVKLSERVYLAKINFEPVINHIYYLYQREDGTDFLSMIGPDEWGRVKPFAVFLGKIQLLSDHTWEILEGEELHTE
ncbi:MAG: DUF2452 domain-containing protein [Cyclobacteriaceae bacterium]